MNVLETTAAAAALVMLSTSASVAHAAAFMFEGHIAYQKDVIRISFTLDQDATDVKVWTDGFMGGMNFDPVTAVWALPSGDLVGDNDDNDTIAPGQTSYDSGLEFPALSAGDYLFTIAAHRNFANTSNLAGGFAYDGDVPIAIGDWCQPSSDNCLDQKGTYWRANLSGVDAAAIPEPSTYAMVALGLAVAGGAARARHRASVRR
jgi:hypothetical protein